MVQLSKGVEIRSQIDTEQVRSLLLINGGGAVALLTLLPKILDSDKLQFLARPVLIGIMLLMTGLVFAVIHNQLRRQCSLLYERYQMQPPRGKLLGFELPEPGICFLSHAFMWLSVASFALAGFYVAVCGLNSLGHLR